MTMKKQSKTRLWASVVLVILLGLLGHIGWKSVVLTRAKDPGLGLRGLHAQGITGSGVSVAIIDGHIRTDHIEYRNQLAHYEELSDFEGIPLEAHGSSVASILVGKQTGVAPGAQLYYFAQNFAQATPADTAEAVRHILAFNAELPAEKRIRVVSISNGWPDQMPGVEEFTAAVEKARQAGVLVVTSRYPYYTQPPLGVHKLGCPPFKDHDDPLNYEMSPAQQVYVRDQNQNIATWLQSAAQLDRDNGYVTLYVPTYYRTLAGPRQGMGARGYGPKDYYYDVEGGDSWATPYLSGVVALALQVNPQLTVDEMVGLLAEGVYELENGVRLIAPEKVVHLAQSQ